MNERVPFVSDRGVRRYRIFNFDFDSRPHTLQEAPGENWSVSAKADWQLGRDGVIAGIQVEYGERHLEQKVEDFKAFGAKPFSIIAHHNAMFNNVRTAFVSGAYYAALTAACALGERILNHLMIDLRDHYKATPQYKHVFRKGSFAQWTLVIDTLEVWSVLLPEVTIEFRALEKLRNRSIHFNADTATQLRSDALSAISHLTKIIGNQFSAFGMQPWFIEGTAGACFIKQDWETHPFVAHYYCSKNLAVGPLHSVELTEKHGWHFVDHPDYITFGLNGLSDDQFKDMFNDHEPSWVARTNRTDEVPSATS